MLGVGIFAFLATYVMNTWKAWEDVIASDGLKGWDGVVLHSFVPGLVLASVVVAPLVRKALANCVEEAYEQQMQRREREAAASRETTTTPRPSTSASTTAPKSPRPARRAVAEPDLRAQSPDRSPGRCPHRQRDQECLGGRQRPIRRTLDVLGGRIDVGEKAILCYFDWLTEPERIAYSLIAAFVLTNAAAQIPYVGDLIVYIPVLHYFDVQSWFG